MLSEPQRRLLSKELLLLSSDTEGEVLAAAYAIRRTLRSAGLCSRDLSEMFSIDKTGPAYEETFMDGYEACLEKNQIIAEPKYYYDMLIKLEKNSNLNKWERNFVSSVLKSYFRTGTGDKISTKQEECIRRIYGNYYDDSATS